MIHFIHNTQDIFYICVYVPAGVIYESSTKLGISHMLEHMMYKRTRKLSGDDIIEKATELGSVFNAGTDKDNTYYYFITVSNAYKKAIHLIGQMLLEPKFTQKELDEERKVVFEELYSGIDYDDKQLWTVFSWQSILSKESLYNRKVIGEIDTLQSITVKDLRHYYNQRYRDMVVFVNCNRKYKKQIYDEICKVFPKDVLTNVRRDEEFPQIDNDLEVKVIVRYKNFNQNTLLLSFPILCSDMTLKDVVILEFINYILTGSGLYSMLMHTLRTKKNLVYGVESQFEPYTFIKLFRISLSTTSENVIDLLRTIFNILNRIQHGLPISKYRFYKESFLRNLNIGLTSYNYISVLMANLAIHFNITDKTSNDILNCVKSITQDDIKKWITMVFQKNNCGVVWNGSMRSNIQSIADEILHWLKK